MLITPDGGLLTVRRVRPGQDPYWVLPGGGAEDGEDLEAALARELREEVAATAEIHSLIYVFDHGGDRHYFYLARAHAWSASAADRTGPEFTDPTRGEYEVQLVPLTLTALEGIDLKPDALAQFVLSHLREGTDFVCSSRSPRQPDRPDLSRREQRGCTRAKPGYGPRRRGQ